MTLSAAEANPARATIDSAYRELHAPLLRYAEGMLGSRADAEEAVHDAFIAALRQDRLDDPRPWLFRVTHNAAISIIRRRRGLVGIDAAGESPAADPTPYAQAELGEQLELLRHGLDKLPDRSRSALVLRELAGLSYAEIGGVLDVSEANVKVLIFRARRSLHELWDAVSADCDGVQLALSAAADGEQGRVSAARARLHATHCRPCGAFAASVGEQRAGLLALVPMAAGVPGSHMAAAVAAHTVSGGKAGGLWGAKTLIALVAAGATVTAGGAALESTGLVGHPHHPAPLHVRTPTPPSGVAAFSEGSGQEQTGVAEDRGPGGEDRGQGRASEDTTGASDGGLTSEAQGGGDAAGAGGAESTGGGTESGGAGAATGGSGGSGEDGSGTGGGSSTGSGSGDN